MHALNKRRLQYSYNLYVHIEVRNFSAGNYIYSRCVGTNTEIEYKRWQFALISYYACTHTYSYLYNPYHKKSVICNVHITYAKNTIGESSLIKVSYQ